MPETDKLLPLLHGLLDEQEYLISAHDLEGRCLIANSATAALLGTTPEAMRNHYRESFVSARMAARQRTHDHLVASENRRLYLEEHVDWPERQLLLASVKFPIRDDSGKVFAVGTISTDITEARKTRSKLNQVREELKAFALNSLKLLEDERTALSRELHDGIGQTLTALKLSLTSAQRKLKGDNESALGDITQGLEIIEGLFTTVRNLSRELRPPQLDELGLVPALRWHLDQVRQRCSLQINFEENQGLERLSPGMELAIFRIVQEAVSNTLRHAQAKHVTVNLTKDDKRQKLSVRDDGRGFDLPTTLRNSSQLQTLGLLGMRERAAALGGNFQIKTTPGLGTEVQAQIPLEQAMNPPSPSAWPADARACRQNGPDSPEVLATGRQG